MKSVKSHVREVQAEIGRARDLERRLAGLERQRQLVAEAVRAGTQKLILALAEERGILRLTPPQIIAMFKSLTVPTIDDTGGTDAGPPASADAAALDVDAAGLDEVEVAVRFGNHDGDRKRILQNAGLVRNGRLGEWRGHVDRATLIRLQEAFSGKITVAVHEQSTSRVEPADPTANEAVVPPQTIAMVDVPTSSEATSATTMAVAEGSSEGADGPAEAFGSGRPPATSVPKLSSGLPRRPTMGRLIDCSD